VAREQGKVTYTAAYQQLLSDTDVDVRYATAFLGCVTVPPPDERTGQGGAPAQPTPI